MLTSNKYRLEKLLHITDMIESCDWHIQANNKSLQNTAHISNHIPSVKKSIVTTIAKYEGIKERLTKYYNSLTTKLDTI